MRALAPGASFYRAFENLEDRKNVPQRLKPGMSASFTARLRAMPFLRDRVLNHALKPASTAEGGAGCPGIFCEGFFSEPKL